ncbi:hypothetical protein FAGAP_7322 [Fusarium agapanthi]|uniref:Uncharacterized protein n=1 Tax=Fusarium agapanthi TaxID=1803897 RepID=A0A9P5B9A5_9HYPO|nr:hypothetical protein FAGAP_7322 [Fusarium agapanthi]
MSPLRPHLSTRRIVIDEKIRHDTLQAESKRATPRKTNTVDANGRQVVTHDVNPTKLLHKLSVCTEQHTPKSLGIGYVFVTAEKPAMFIAISYEWPVYLAILACAVSVCHIGAVAVSMPLRILYTVSRCYAQMEGDSLKNYDQSRR